MKTSTIFTFFGGTALGAVVMLLLAPKSGRKTRKKLKKQLKKHGIDLSSGELNDLVARFKPDHAKK